MPADPFLVQSFWTYPRLTPPNTNVAAGTPFDFNIVIPPSGPLFPITGSVVNWKLADVTTAADPKPLVSGVDYLLLAGDLHSPLLSVVFAPIAGRKVSVLPEVTLFYWNATAPTPVLASPSTITMPADYPHFAPQTYTFDGLGSVEKDRLLELIKDAVCLVADKTIIEPGEPVLLNVLPRSLSTVPQTVTSVVDEAPKVEIRGAIPLKALVDAIVGPLTGALSKAVPGSRTSLESAGDDVARLLGQALSIPLAIDVLGKRVSKTLAPIGDAQAPLFTSSPAETRTLHGLVPIGKWQLPFTIARVEWSIDGAPAMDLSPGVDFIKAFLLLPRLVALSRFDPGSLPSPVTVRVKLHVNVETDVVAVLGSIDLSLDLQLLPLAIPRVAVVFRHAFDTSYKKAPLIWLCPDPSSAPFIPSSDDALRLFTTIATVLNNVVAVVHRLLSVAPADYADWNELVDHATVFSILMYRLGRADPGHLRMLPAWTGRASLDDNRISAVIYVGPQGPVRCDIGMTDNDSDYISLHRSCVLATLHGSFEDLVQVPPGAATAVNPSADYREQQEVRFTGCPAEVLLGGTQMAGGLETLREFRDRDLMATAAGKRYVALLERHSMEVTRLLLQHEDLASMSLEVVRRLVPLIRARGEARPATLDDDLIQSVDRLLRSAAPHASQSLSAAIATARKDLRHFSGRTLSEGLERMG